MENHAVLSRRGLCTVLVGAATNLLGQTEKEIPPAPLFRDPIYDGASDPVVIWHRQEQCWWMLYTQRRANVNSPVVAWVHGCDIGVARSKDGGRVWRYLGRSLYSPHTATSALALAIRNRPDSSVPSTPHCRKRARS